MDILNILSQPITQFVGIIGIVAALQRSGIDVGALFKALVGIKQSTTETIDFDNRAALQQLMTSMETLSGHYNHETTELLTNIRDSLGALNTMLMSNFQAIHSTHDEWNRRGIPTEDCKSTKK